MPPRRLLAIAFADLALLALALSCHQSQNNKPPPDVPTDCCTNFGCDDLKTCCGLLSGQSQMDCLQTLTAQGGVDTSCAAALQTEQAASPECASISPTGCHQASHAAELCFGAQGRQCTPLQNDPTNLLSCGAGTVGPTPTIMMVSPCLTDPDWLPVDAGLQYQAVSVGSMEHDQCCRQDPNGHQCGGMDDGACATEWKAASTDATTDGRNWRRLFETSQPTPDDIFVRGSASCQQADGGTSCQITHYGLGLRAPPGVFMDPGNECFCMSGQLVKLTDDADHTVCAPLVPEDPVGVEPVVGGDPGSAADDGGNCFQYKADSNCTTGGATCLRHYLTRQQSLASLFDTVMGDQLYDMIDYFTQTIGPVSTKEVWTYVDARKDVLGVAVLAMTSTGWKIEELSGLYPGYAARVLDCVIEKANHLPLTAKSVLSTPLVEGGDTYDSWWMYQVGRRNKVTSKSAMWDATQSIATFGL